MTIFYKGFHASEGTTGVSRFWGDVHVLDFRADAVIESFEDLKDQVARFEADPTQFDVVDWGCGYKAKKAVRNYEVNVVQRVDFEKVVFTYKGDTYCTKTRKHTVVMKIDKMADEVLEHKYIQTMSLVSEPSGDVLGIKEVLGEVEARLPF